MSPAEVCTCSHVRISHQRQGLEGGYAMWRWCRECDCERFTNAEMVAAYERERPFQDMAAHARHLRQSTMRIHCESCRTTKIKRMKMSLNSHIRRNGERLASIFGVS